MIVQPEICWVLRLLMLSTIFKQNLKKWEGVFLIQINKILFYLQIMNRNQFQNIYGKEKS